MVIHILRNVVLMVCNHDPSNDTDLCDQRVFQRGELHTVGEYSPTDHSTLFEVHGLGYVDIPNDAWEFYQAPLFRFDPRWLSNN